MDYIFCLLHEPTFNLLLPSCKGSVYDWWLYMLRNHNMLTITWMCIIIILYLICELYCVLLESMGNVYTITRIVSLAQSVYIQLALMSECIHVHLQCIWCYFILHTVCTCTCMHSFFVLGQFPLLIKSLSLETQSIRLYYDWGKYVLP